jgi:Domain of unknown function (DUF4328)
MSLSALDRGLASLRVRGSWTRGLLIASLLASAVGFAIGLLTLLSTFGTGPLAYINPPPLFAAATQIMSLLNLILFIALVIFILLWIHRAHANLRVIGLDGLNYSPAWAVGCFFVPIANLISPFRTMRELHNRSFGEEAHFAASTVEDVNSWWTCFLVSNLITLYIVATVTFGQATGIHVVTPMGVDQAVILFANVLGMGAIVFLYRIVGSVTQAQQSTTGINQTFA